MTELVWIQGHYNISKDDEGNPTKEWVKGRFERMGNIDFAKKVDQLLEKLNRQNARANPRREIINSK